MSPASVPKSAQPPYEPDWNSSKNWRSNAPMVERRTRMQNSKILVLLAVALLIVALSSVAVGQDKATAQEVVAKVREAASTLSKTGDVAPFNQKQGPWVWKDTYIFVEDCDKKVLVAKIGRGHV